MPTGKYFVNSYWVISNNEIIVHHMIITMFIRYMKNVRSLAENTYHNECKIWVFCNAEIYLLIFMVLLEMNNYVSETLFI